MPSDSTLDRRGFLRLSSLAALTSGIEPLTKVVAQSAPPASTKADYALRIATGLVELSPDHIVSTTLYNGQFPGPLLRFKEGQRVVVDVHNDTDTPEFVHWHGQMIPSDVDGAAEEGTPLIPAHGMRRISFVPKPSGFRFYHTHIAAGGDLNRGTYTGQAGPPAFPSQPCSSRPACRCAEGRLQSPSIPGAGWRSCRCPRCSEAVADLRHPCLGTDLVFGATG
jgi:Multicopper oxidase